MVVIYRLISLQTVIQYFVVYLLYMNKSLLKWIQHPSTKTSRAYYYSVEDRQLI
jgi:hypothetical protein